MDPDSSKKSTISPEIFDEYNTKLQAAALLATRNALSLPSDLAFHRSMDPELAKELDTFSSKVLSLTNSILTLVSTSETSQAPRGTRRLKLEGRDDVVDNFHSLVVDSMDQLLERTDICLDEYLGRTKPPAIVVNPKPAPQTKKNVPQGRLDPALQHASHLQKPQLSFKGKLDNSDNTPWHPTLTHKYNAQVPLGYEYRDSEEESSATGITANKHPYHYEVKHISYPDWMFCSAPPVPPRSFDETPFTWVDTPAAFTNMLHKLRTATELAVDLEHHSYRTYRGFLCLMQISTREQDWIIDTLRLREELVELNEVFTDPKIVKVFHGAESDILWLQQDFNLFIVNLFDTYHASKVLNYPRHGLANLLEMYCDFTADKRYQLADWRIRPLPEEMLLYARSDTHFLLYIYDNLRNALFDRPRSCPQSPQPQSHAATSPPPNESHNLIKEVLSRSEETALRTYEKEVYDAENGSGSAGWDTLAKKWNKGALLLPSVQRNVFSGVHGWRDRIAQEEDESVRYVLPNHYLLRLAEQPPTNIAALMAVFHPVPPVIRKRAKELFDIIKSSVISGSSTPRDPEKPTVEANTTTLPVDVQVDIAPAPLVGDGDASRLWGNVPRTSKAIFSTSSSSLFGSTLASRPLQAFSTFSNLLFRSASVSATYPISDGDDSRFRDLVARIHSKLVISPSIPKVIPKEESADEVTQTANGLEVQVEIPYVPPSHRTTIVPTVDDSIVVVGQARQKKRKRAKQATQDAAGDLSGSVGTSQAEKAEGSSKKKAKKVKAEADSVPEEPFDYSAVPNILDDRPQEPELRQRKKRAKQNKGGVLEYGNFPAPPRAHRELKSGNQSHTFK